MGGWPRWLESQGLRERESPAPMGTGKGWGGSMWLQLVNLRDPTGVHIGAILGRDLDFHGSQRTKVQAIVMAYP